MKILLLIAIFRFGFEPQFGSVSYFINEQPIVELEGCNIDYINISDTSIYSVDLYQISCTDSITDEVLGTNHKSAVFINDVGLFCNIDSLQIYSHNKFDMVLDCN